MGCIDLIRSRINNTCVRTSSSHSHEFFVFLHHFSHWCYPRIKNKKKSAPTINYFYGSLYSAWRSRLSRDCIRKGVANRMFAFIYSEGKLQTSLNKSLLLYAVCTHSIRRALVSCGVLSLRGFKIDIAFIREVTIVLIPR